MFFTHKPEKFQVVSTIGTIEGTYTKSSDDCYEYIICGHEDFEDNYGRSCCGPVCYDPESCGDCGSCGGCFSCSHKYIELKLVQGQFWEFWLYEPGKETFLARADASKTGQLPRNRLTLENVSYILICNLTSFQKNGFL